MRLALVALTTASLALVAAPAGAETWHTRDARGDVHAYSFSPEPPPCGTSTESTDPTDARRDITGLAVDHRADAVEITLSLRDARRRDRGTSFMIHLLTPTEAFQITLLREEKGRMDPLLAPEKAPPSDAGGDECGTSMVLTIAHTCVGLSAVTDPRRDDVVVTVPRPCLKDPRWVKAGAESSGGFTRGPDQGFVIHDDEWAPPGVSGPGLVPVYGPRVRVG